MMWKKVGLPKTRGGLGFKGFHCLNKALLAKQIWHLRKNPDSLIARIIKAKYHPNDSVLKAILGKKTILCLEKYLGFYWFNSRTYLEDWEW